MSCALEDKTKLLVLLIDNNNFCRILKSLSYQYSDSKFWVRWVWANSTDPDQTAQTKVRNKVTEMYIHAISGSLLFEPRRGKTGFLHMGKQRRRSASR